MRPFIISFFASGCVAFLDKLLSKPNPWQRYAMWALIIYACILLNNQLQAEVYEFDYRTKSLKEFNGSICPEFRWLPTGVPPSDVDDNGLPSEQARRKIRATGKRQALQGGDLHQAKAQEYADQLCDMSIFELSMSEGEKLKIVIATAAAMCVPGGPCASIGAAFLAITVGFSCHYVDNWEKIRNVARMEAWHSEVASEYCRHIHDNGWY